jgi:hypothetical protein
MQAAATLSSSPSGTPALAPVVSRISANALDGLEQFQSSGALGAGQVNLIALDAIAERLAERWQGRREAVYDMVERVLERRMGPNGFCIRVSETEFLVAQPDFGAFGAQASCLRSLAEILKHFLGAAAHQDLRVRQVTQITDNEIVAVPIDPTAAVQGSVREAEAAESAARLAALQAQADADPTLLAPERWSPFVAADGRKVRVSCKLEPVFELKQNTRIGYRLSRRVIDTVTEEPLSTYDIQRLSRSDHLRIDMATISRGLARMEAGGTGEQELSLIIPVSYVTLSYQEGRTTLSHAFTRARKAVVKGILCEVCDIEGVPQVALLSAISLIRPWSLFVIGHLSSDTPQGSVGMKEAGLQAVSFTCPANISGDAEFLGWLREATRSARKAAKTQMVYGCNPRRLALAGLMGATHASVGAP